MKLTIYCKSVLKSGVVNTEIYLYYNR